MSAVANFEELRHKAEHIEELVTPPESTEESRADSGATRFERRDAWYSSVLDAILDLSQAMPEGVEDYDVRKLFELVVPMRRLMDADVDAVDADGEIELVTMQAADIARRLHRRLVHEHLDDPQVAAKVVFDGLAQVPVSDLANLLGVSTKTVRSWQNGSTIRNNMDRVVLVAQLMTYLRSSMTALGVMMWFEAERDQLDGRTPLQLMDSDLASAYQVLLDLARGSRAQLGS